VSRSSELLAGERAESAGDYASAAAAYREVAADPEELTAAEARFRLGRVSWRQSRFEAALREFETAGALAARVQATELCARIANGIGAVHYARGNYLEARHAYSEARALTHDGAMLGKIILNLGVIANIEGDLEAARAHYEEAYRLFDSHGDRPSAALALHNRGMVEADQEQWENADRSFAGALDLATRDGDADLIARTLVNRSEVLAARGQMHEVIAHCDRALELFALQGDELGRGEALCWRARGGRLLGDLAMAERNATEAVQIASRCGARLLEAEANRELGEVKRARGSEDAARVLLQRALELFRELGSVRDVEAVERVLR
jgi:tetratricopeptide (TPR) repeat protein